jgi:hypothetical protein
MRLPIVILSGPAGCGKDTVARFMKEHAGAVAIAQADPMKELARELFDFKDEQLWGPSHRRMETTDRPCDLSTRLEINGSRWLRSIGLGTKEAHRLLKAWAATLPEEVTARQVLQTLGTEWGRSINTDLWVNLALERARGELAAGAPMAVITDGRFRNEILAVKAAGGAAVRIVTPGAGLTGEAAKHVSETEQASIPEWWFDEVLENDKARGLEHLKRAVFYLTTRLFPARARLA